MGDQGRGARVWSGWFNDSRRLEPVYNHGQFFEGGAQVVEHKR